MKNKFLVLLLMLFCAIRINAQDSIQKFAYHFQQTLVGQSASSHKLTTGQDSSHNSFSDATMKISMSSTFYLGFKLWKNGSFYIDPDIAGGAGLGGTLGIAGYMNGEIFRVGNPAPAIYISRMYIRQYFPLGKSSSYVSPDANQLGEIVPDSRIQLSFGKMSLADMFDCNHYSHDPRTRFLNWSLMNAGAYDFASNTKGYTYAVVTEYITPGISARVGAAIEPQYSNGPLTTNRYIANRISLLDMEVRLPNQGYSLNFELEKPIKQRSGKNAIIRLLAFINHVNAGKYTDATDSIKKNPGSEIFISSDQNGNGSRAMVDSRKPNAIKYGFSLNIEKPIGKHAGVFSRLSWNDGKTESFAFAEIDRSECIGLVIHGTAYHRYYDRIEAAVVFNQISKEHQDYLSAGGYGFMLGESGWKYAGEAVIEFQYVYDLGKNFMVSPDFQIILNPGYDMSRGSIYVTGLRTHISF